MVDGERKIDSESGGRNNLMIETRVADEREADEREADETRLLRLRDWVGHKMGVSVGVAVGAGVDMGVGVDVSLERDGRIGSNCSSSSHSPSLIIALAQSPSPMSLGASDS